MAQRFPDPTRPPTTSTPPHLSPLRRISQSERWWVNSTRPIRTGMKLLTTWLTGQGIPTIRSLLWIPTAPLRPRPHLITKAMHRPIPFGVQAKDEFNATVEGNFTVTLTDLNEALTSLPMEEDQPLVFYWRRIKPASLP